MRRLTPQLTDTGGIHVERWITVTPTEPQEWPRSYLPCSGDRFYRAQHRRHRGEIPSWLIGTVAGLSSVAVLVVSGLEGWL